MKQIFEILQEERDKILEMHVNATKKQYLIELEEPDDPGFGASQSELDKVDNSQRALGTPEEKIEKKSSYTTQKWNQFSYSQASTSLVTRGIAKGAKFEVTNDPLKITAKGINVFFRDGDNWVKNPKLVNISFYCKQGKFYITGEENEAYVSETLSKALVKYVCGYKKEKSVNTQSSETPKSSGKTKYLHKLKASWGDIIIPAESSIVPNEEKKGVSIKTQKGNWVWFNCKKGVFSFNNSEVTPYNDALKNSLKQDYCKKGGGSNDIGYSSSGDIGGNVGGATVTKPNDTALDTILQKISAGSQKPTDPNQAPQTFIG